MKCVLLSLCLLLLSACNGSKPNAASIPADTQAPAKKLLTVTIGGKRGYIDRTGKIVVNPQYDSADDFSEGLARVCVGQCDTDHWRGFRYTKDQLGTEKVEQTFKYGFIDETGKMVINPGFESAEMFSDGMAGVCVGRGCYYRAPTDRSEAEEKWGYIDKTGAMVIPPQFGYVSTFHEGLAAVEIGDKWGYIDKTGKFVINPQYDSASQFENGVAKVGLKLPRTDPDSVISNYQEGYIDRSGKYIWQPSL